MKNMIYLEVPGNLEAYGKGITYANTNTRYEVVSRVRDRYKNMIIDGLTEPDKILTTDMLSTFEELYDQCTDILGKIAKFMEKDDTYDDCRYLKINRK